MIEKETYVKWKSGKIERCGVVKEIVPAGVSIAQYIPVEAEKSHVKIIRDISGRDRALVQVLDDALNASYYSPCLHALSAVVAEPPAEAAEAAEAPQDESPVKDDTPRSQDALKGTVSVDIYLSSGARLELDLPQYMAEQIYICINALSRGNRPICACHVDGELIAIDTQEIAVFRAFGVGECVLSPRVMGNINALPHKSAPAGNRNAVNYKAEAIFYKIECKCGTEYICRLGSDRRKANCKKCGATVYRDNQVVEPLDNGGEATLMTNRYYVPQETRQDNLRSDKIEPKPYVDPCQIFDSEGAR